MVVLRASVGKSKLTLNGEDVVEVELKAMVVLGGGGSVVERLTGARRGLDVPFTASRAVVVVVVVVISVVAASSSSTRRRGPNVVVVSSVRFSRRRIQSSMMRDCRHCAQTSDLDNLISITDELECCISSEAAL